MSSGCSPSRFALVQGHIRMIGLSAHLPIREKMLGGEIQEGIITAVYLVQIFGRVPAVEVMRVNMHMGCLNVGFILLNIELGFVKMALIVLGEYAFLPTLPKSSVLCTFLVDRAFLLQGLQHLQWIWQQ